MPAPRWILLCSLAVSLLSGCQPSDPLDWKISARNPADLNKWAGKNMILLPPELAKELTISIEQIANHTQRTGVSSDEKARYSHANPVCRQLHQHTVRDVIISGYLMANTMLLHQINRELGNISKVTTMLSQTEPNASKYRSLELRIKYHQQLVDRANTQLEANNRRISTLENRNASQAQ